MVLTAGKLPLGASSFDLHVLGTPPAFILSQDQTLRTVLCGRNHFRTDVDPCSSRDLPITLQLLRCLVDEQSFYHIPARLSNRRLSPKNRRAQCSRRLGQQAIVIWIYCTSYLLPILLSGLFAVGERDRVGSDTLILSQFTRAVKSLPDGHHTHNVDSADGTAHVLSHLPTLW
jgi:hypothetical protein